MRDKNLARSIGWDDSFRAGLGDQGTQGVTIVSLVGDDAAGLDVGQQGRSHGDVTGLAAGENKAQRATERIGKGMYLSGPACVKTPPK